MYNASGRGCSPPGTGGVDAPCKKKLRSHLSRRGRGGQFGETFRVSDHPVCAASERELFLIGAATPPVPGGEHARLMRFADHTNKRSALSRGAGSRVPAGSVSLFLVLISLDVRLLQVLRIIDEYRHGEVFLAAVVDQADEVLVQDRVAAVGNTVFAEGTRAQTGC